MSIVFAALPQMRWMMMKMVQNIKSEESDNLPLRNFTLRSLLLHSHTQSTVTLVFCLRNYTGFQCFHSRVLLLVLLKQQRSFELFEVLWNGSYYLRTTTTNKTGPKWKTNFTWDGESCRMIRRIIFRKVFLRIFDKQGHHDRHLSEDPAPSLRNGR